MKDNYRIRNRYLNFHVTDEELRDIEISAKLSQMSKQEFIIKCLLEKEIRLENSVYYSDRLAFEFNKLIEKLECVDTKSETEQEILEILHFIVDGRRFVTKER